MSNHVITMLELSEAQQRLDDTQSLIDWARTSLPENPEIQLAMDRKQLELNHKRNRVVVTMNYIAACN